MPKPATPFGSTTLDRLQNLQGPPLAQNLRCSKLLMLHRDLQRRGAAPVAELRVRPARQEQRAKGVVAVAGGQVEWHVVATAQRMDLEGKG